MHKIIHYSLTRSRSYLSRVFLLAIAWSISRLSFGCDGCTLSRLEFYHPGYRIEMWIGVIWFIFQGITSAFFFGKHWWTWIAMGLCFAYSSTIGRLIGIDYWPAWLIVYPFIVQLGSLSFVTGYRFNQHRWLWMGLAAVMAIMFTPGFPDVTFMTVWFTGVSVILILYVIMQKKHRSWPRIFLAITWGLGIVMIVTLNANAYIAKKQQGKISLVERILDHGARAAAIAEVGKMRERGPEGLVMLREILKKGNVQILKDYDPELAQKGIIQHGSRSYGLGQVLLMRHAASILLSIGDPEVDVPLILSAIERIEPAIHKAGINATGLRMTLIMYFEERYQVQVDLDASINELRNRWEALSSIPREPKIREM